ncbi:MAG: aminoglycoside phosphotransferase family protein [Ktedonobacteraceae bacterium]
MIVMNGEEAIAWLERLPTVLANCERGWDIIIGPPFALSFNYVAPAVRPDGTQLVVKVCSLTDEFPQQPEALRLVDGRGMVQMIDCDTSEEVMLLERLIPGTMLREEENDEVSTSCAASIMQKIWRPVPENHPFKTVQDWEKGFDRLRQHYDGGTGPFPKVLLGQAETLYRELSASMAEPVLLHGDLHHENILAAEREPWLAIDPKGVVGEPAYETGAWLRNPIPQLLDMPYPGRILARRIDQLSEQLGFDRARIRDWALAQAMLSAWWSMEDSGELSIFAITCAELLAAIRL